MIGLKKEIIFQKNYSRYKMNALKVGDVVKQVIHKTDAENGWTAWNNYYEVKNITDQYIEATLLEKKIVSREMWNGKHVAYTLPGEPTSTIDRFLFHNSTQDGLQPLKWKHEFETILTTGFFEVTAIKQ